MAAGWRRRHRRLLPQPHKASAYSPCPPLHLSGRAASLGQAAARQGHVTPQAAGGCTMVLYNIIDTHPLLRHDWVIGSWPIHCCNSRLPPEPRRADLFQRRAGGLTSLVGMCGRTSDGRSICQLKLYHVTPAVLHARSARAAPRACHACTPRPLPRRIENPETGRAGTGSGVVLAMTQQS